MIDINKKYTTTEGKEVRIYATDGAGDYPIHGAVLDTTQWVLTKWRGDGRYASSPHLHDLVEVWAPKDKEPIWCWDSGHTSQRILRFWDAKNNCTFLHNGKRDSPSVWENFAKVENVEQWMLDIQAKLED